MSDVIQHQSLGSLVANQLRKSIWNREISFGENLIESDLSKKYGVSRSTVRDALKTLEYEGLVIIKPRKGAHVAEFSNQDWKEIIELRIIIETHAFIKLSEQLTESHIKAINNILNEMKQGVLEENWTKLFDLDLKYHSYVVSLLDNSRIIKLYKSIQVQIRAFLINLDKYYSSYEAFYQEQRHLFEALQTKDPKLIKETIGKHIGYVEEHVLAEL